MPPAVSGESAFAASGTCLVAQGQSNVWFATGGAGKGRVFRSVNRGQTWTVSETPVPAATNSAGIFSLAFRDERHGVAVGGNHEKHSETRHNFVMTEDGGASWQESSTNKPRGFRSGVAWLGRLKRSALVAVGPSGSDFRSSNGQWQKLDDANYNVISVGRFNPQAVWAAGPKGRIARLIHVPEGP
jgi:photosystem II stability/assembly factor-like uncharacterized protein